MTDCYTVPGLNRQCAKHGTDLIRDDGLGDAYCAQKAADLAGESLENYTGGRRNSEVAAQLNRGFF